MKNRRFLLLCESETDFRFGIQDESLAKNKIFKPEALR